MLYAAATHPLQRTCRDQLLLLLLAQVDAALAPFYIRLQLLEKLGLYSMPDGGGGRGVEAGEWQGRRRGQSACQAVAASLVADTVTLCLSRASCCMF
jgi:hypothetical protein